MYDSLSPEQRSERMARVRNAGNRSTEGRVEALLVSAGVTGWVKHPTDVLGKPDFYFPDLRLAVFVDGCFWHACPVCNRRAPKNRADFWREKIEGNRKRDARQRRRLRAEGFHVMRIWEHEVKTDRWLKRLRTMMHRAR